MKTIYKRQYDNPLKEDGTEKENELLGTFEVTKQIFEDATGYSNEEKGRAIVAVEKVLSIINTIRSEGKN